MKNAIIFMKARRERQIRKADAIYFLSLCLLKHN